MDLNSILEKTKNKAKNIKINRPSVHIAYDERPYESFKETIQNEPSQKNQRKEIATEINVIKQKVNTNSTHNKEKTTHILDTNQTQDSQKETQTKHNIDTEPGTRSNTKHTQTKHNIDTTVSISTLVGLQKKLLFFVYYSCKKSRNCQSEPLAINNMSELLRIPVGSIKTTMVRLEEKGFLKKSLSKNGRGGWSIYEIPELIYRELFHLEIEYKLDTNQIQFEHKSDTKSNTQAHTSISSSSSYINSTTTRDEAFIKFNGVNIEPLKKYGLSDSHIKQLEKIDYLTLEELQDSIDHFAFDLEKNNKEKEIRTSSINYFMGIIRKEGVYNAPSNYESPREKALREYQENKKREEERLKELLGGEYKNYRNQKIKEIYESSPEDLKLKLGESFQSLSSGVGVMLFKKEGLNNSIALADFSDFVSIHQSGLFKDIPNFLEFCDMKLKQAI